jgi:hypothetical protein
MILWEIPKRYTTDKNGIKCVFLENRFGMGQSFLLSAKLVN